MATSREQLLKAFMSGNKRKRKPPRERLPKNVSAEPQEDSALFNPLIHGNRNPGRFGTRPKYRRYKGPSRGR